MALTEYGKAVRKYRIDAEITAKEMADALGVTPAYLSALETGKRRLGNAFLEKVIQFFDDRGIDASDLYDAAAATQTEVHLDMSGLNGDTRAKVAAFARNFSSMDADRKRELLEDLLKKMVS